MLAKQISQELQALKNPARAKHSQRFFKTGKGEYGEGDIFLGIRVPVQRQIAKKYIDLPLSEVGKLLTSKIHTYRFVALIILTYQYEKASENNQRKLYDFYLKNTKWINNWDLVDCSAHKIVGQYLLDKNAQRKILYKLAKSSSLWKKRIAIISTFTFIKNNQLEDTAKISQLLLNDKHDLIHKAVGWMLREMGKKNESKLIEFLEKNVKIMPRTCLRYAIERLKEKERKYFLKR
jgi:3-methyladenine DNA glycosylase AlkD